MKAFVSKVKAAVVAFFSRPSVQSVLRHAGTAAVGVLVTAALSTGVTGAVAGVAAASAARVVLLAIQGALSD